MAQAKKSTSTKTMKKSTASKSCGCKKTCAKTSSKKGTARKQDDFNVYLVMAMSVIAGGLLIANTVMFLS